MLIDKNIQFFFIEFKKQLNILRKYFDFCSNSRKSEYFIPDVSQTVVVGHEKIEISKRQAGSIFMDGWDKYFWKKYKELK